MSPREPRSGDPAETLSDDDRSQGVDGPATCEHCQGVGEIVTDWDRYLEPRLGDTGDEAVAECPECNGTGRATPMAGEPVRNPRAR